MMNQPSSCSVDSLTAPSCRGHSFPCSTSAPCNNYSHFPRFWDQFYGPLRLGIGTEVCLWSQFQIYLTGEFSSFFGYFDKGRFQLVESKKSDAFLVGGGQTDSDQHALG